MKKNTFTSGQALVLLLVFMIMAITITSAAVTIMIVNSQTTSTVEQGNNALNLAESGVEDALIRILRTPTYGGETLTVGDGTVIVSVTGTNPKTITSQATANGYARSIQITITNTNNIWNITSWKEIF